MRRGPNAARVAALSWTLGRTSTWAAALAVALVAHDVGGAVAVATTVAARMVPAGLAAPWLALLADRLPRRSVIGGVSLVRAVALAGAAAVVATGGSFAVVLALVAVEAAITTAHRPAHVALLPGLVATPTELARANGATSTGDYAGFLAGSLVAGLVGAAAGLDVALLVASAAGLAAAAAAAALPVPRLRGLHHDPHGHAGAGLLTGLQSVGRDRELRSLAGIHLLDMAVQATVDVLLVVVALDLLGTGRAGAGLLSAGWGVGGLVAGVLSVRVLRPRALRPALLGGLALAGGSLVLVGALPGPTSAVLLLAGVGVGFCVAEVAVVTLTQRLAPDDVLAQVFGVQEVLTVLGTALGAVLAPSLVLTLGVEHALVATGAVLPLLAVLLVRELGTSTHDHVPARPYALLRGLPMLAELPVSMIETMAVRSEVVDVPTGATVIELGDVGESFYVVDAGAVGVHRGDGGEVARLAVGDAFGEIALLRDTPRTARVVANEPSRLLVIDRGTFLLALGSHGRSRHVANLLVEERLATFDGTA